MKYIKTCHLDALSCHDCANEVIDNLIKFDFIKEVHIDYDKGDITIHSVKELTDEQALDIIKNILEVNHCKDHDNHNYGHLHHIVTEEFGLDVGCADCAKDVQTELNKNTDIIDAKVSYANKKVVIKHLDNVEIYDILEKTVSGVEDDASVYGINEVHEQKAVCHNKHHHHHENQHNEDVCECHHHDHDHSEGHHHIGCDCHEEEEDEKTLFGNILFILGVLLYIASSIIFFIRGGDSEISYLSYNYFMFIGAYILIGYDIIIKSIKGIIRGKIFNENFLMVIASLGSLAILEPFEATMVILLYKIGEALQDHATEKSERAIMSLYDLKCDYVTMENGEKRNIKEVKVGDVITVKVGEKIPLDGEIVGDGTDVDMKALTGESRPVYLNSGDEIYSGAINLTKVINIEVTKVDSDSTVSKMLKLVDEASSQKAKTERFITKFAKVYTPIVLIIAFLVGLIKGLIFSEEIVTILNDVFSILVISCPCALVISIPLGYFAGIGRLSSLGILVKGGNYLEVLSKLDTVVFDKTGTITKGNFKVVEVNAYNNHSKEEVLEKIAQAEYYSTHPIAESIKSAYNNHSKSELKLASTYNIEELSGLGLNVKKVENNNVLEDILVGNLELMKRFNIKLANNTELGTVVHLAINNEYYGNVVIRDEIKESSFKAIKKLNETNKTLMISGDSEDICKLIANEVGISEYKSQLLPKMKYDYLKEVISESKGKVCYVGDGINDAPVLRLADVGVAMGGIGSDSAKEAADVVIMNDDLNKIYEVINVSKFTKFIILENIIFALSFKIIALVLSIVGVLGSYMMILAVFADVGVCLLAILNSLRILKKKVKD